MKQTKRVTILCCLLAWILLLGGCTPTEHTMPQTDSLLPAGLTTEAKEQTEDALARFVFLGESTTYHLKSRGVLSGGTETKQVWGPASGTVCLDERIVSLKIIYPETGEILSLSDALSKKQPEQMLLTFGLNGVVGKYTKGKEAFHRTYRTLLSVIRSASPHTQIFLGSCYPVAKNMDSSAYGVSAEEINRYLDTLNHWTQELAEEEKLTFLNFAPLLKDETGALSQAFQTGDGIHLTAEAYRIVLNFIKKQITEESGYEASCKSMGTFTFGAVDGLLHRLSTKNLC